MLRAAYASGGYGFNSAHRRGRGRYDNKDRGIPGNGNQDRQVPGQVRVLLLAAAVQMAVGVLGPAPVPEMQAVQEGEGEWRWEINPKILEKASYQHFC